MSEELLASITSSPVLARGAFSLFLFLSLVFPPPSILIVMAAVCYYLTSAELHPLAQPPAEAASATGPPAQPTVGSILVRVFAAVLWFVFAAVL